MVQKRVKPKFEYANLFVVENNMRGFDDLGSRDGPRSLTRRYHISTNISNFRTASRKTAHPSL